jgi:hypothetical protein
LTERGGELYWERGFLAVKESGGGLVGGTGGFVGLESMLVGVRESVGGRERTFAEFSFVWVGVIVVVVGCWREERI